MASAATGVLGSVIGKLAGMLTEKYQLAKKVKSGIRFMQHELSIMEAVLMSLEDKDDDQISAPDKEWRSKVRELSYDIEDCIDRFMLNHSNEGSNGNFVRKAVRKVKTLLKDGEIGEEIQELKRQLSEQSDQRNRYQSVPVPSGQQVPMDPRASALFPEARDLVGIDSPRKVIIQLLKCEQQQHKVVSIYGTGGLGKTTLAMEVYHKITGAFDCRAFVSVSRSLDMKKLLRDILSQISKSYFDESLKLETVEQHIRTVRECLMDKRYLILIDDIWNESAWDNVRSALPINDNGSRIITTTRIKTVASYSCCTGITSQMYEAKPLSDDDSQKLFFKRLFPRTEDCPQDLRKVCNDILKKCSGLPLAIISIAGLLARSKPLEVGSNVLKSISAAADKDSPIEKMKSILLLSYFDLHHHLKSCLLYLSVFPEDHSIDCQQLILLWVAEGLIPGQDRGSMEQLGRSYLNELINRSLVQPTKVGANGRVKLCRVHDIILEFIVSKAVQENFVTIWSGSGFPDSCYSSTEIRRLSIQKDISDEVAEKMANKIKKSTHIRSINIFFDSNSALVTKHASKFLSSQVLRVLNIQGYQVDQCNLGNVNRFGQLKYLGVRTVDYSQVCCKLPEDIEKLQHLETLDVLSVKNLPASIIRMQKLVRLFVRPIVQLPDGISNLQALEELSGALDIQSLKVIQELGDLINLRLLEINWVDSSGMEDHKKACIISTLSNLLTGLQELRMCRSNPDATSSFMAACVSSRPPLQKLIFDRHYHFNRVEPQIRSLVNLTRLYISVHCEASKDGIDILASLPMLLSLTIHVPRGPDSNIITRHAISKEGFQSLVKFNLFSGDHELALEFDMGAMPKLERLKLGLLARAQFKYGEGGLVVGLQNLTGLKHVAVDIYSEDAATDEMEALEDDLSSSAGIHLNRPMLQMARINYIEAFENLLRESGFSSDWTMPQ